MSNKDPNTSALSNRLKGTRRSLLSAGSVVLISGIGIWWIGRPDRDPLNDLPDGVSSADFEWGENTTTKFDESTPPTTKPSIEFDARTNEVHIEGVLTYGSSTCNAITVKNFNYIQGESELYIDVGWEEEGDNSGWLTSSCTDDLDHKPYILTVQFESSLPSGVEVTENHFEPANEDNTRVVSVRAENSE